MVDNFTVPLKKYLERELSRSMYKMSCSLGQVDLVVDRGNVSKYSSN